MNRKNFTKALVLILTLVLFLGNLTVFAEGNKIKIDNQIAKEDAFIHRQDFTRRALLQADTTEAKEEAKEEVAEEAKEEVEKPEVKGYVANNEPNRIVVNIKNDPTSTRTFNWYTTEEFEGKVLVSKNEDMSDAVEFAAEATKVDSHFLERDMNGFFIYPIVEVETEEIVGYLTDEGHKDDEYWTPEQELEDAEKFMVKNPGLITVDEYSYKAEATELEPETVYYYQVGSEEGGMSEVGKFITSSTENKPFSFVHYTDTQNAWWNQHIIDEVAYAVDTVEKMLATDPDADFVLHTGDIVEVAEVEDEWVDLFDRSKEAWMSTTLVPVAGNHDEYCLNDYDARDLTVYNDHFNIPAEGKVDGGTYYSFDYNGVHFIVLNTNDNKNEDNKALGEEQLQWLRDDVAAARENGADWIILNYHKPLFSKSYHSLQDSDVQNVRDEFMKAIDELDIDLALQGHDHVLSRTKGLVYVAQEESVFNAKVADEGEDNVFVKPEGTIFLLPNTGGTKTYDAIYDKGLEHVIKVRPKLDWLTEELLEEYNNLFAFGGQPDESPEFENSHSNFRNSKVQNFARYMIDGNKLSVELYQISGKLDEAREPEIVDSFSIEK